MRVKLLLITPELIAGWLIRGNENHFRIIQDGLPPDMKVVGCHYDGERRCVAIHVQSSEYEELKDGELMPFTANPVMQNMEAR